MLPTVLSSLRFSWSIFASLSCSLVTVGLLGPGIVVPLSRIALSVPGEPPLAAVPAPVVPGGGSLTVSAPVGEVPRGTAGGVIDGLAKPTVPVASGVLAALPAPLGSFCELVSPPTFAGPFGIPLTAAAPRPRRPHVAIRRPQRQMQRTGRGWRALEQSKIASLVVLPFSTKPTTRRSFLTTQFVAAHRSGRCRFSRPSAQSRALNRGSRRR
jgi:hypothetical protein